MILMKMRMTNLVDETFICLDKCAVYGVVMGRQRSERIRHVINTEEYDEQTVGSGPLDLAVIDVGAQKFMFDLVCEALHCRSKARHNDGIVDRGSTIAKVVGLNKTFIVSGCQKVNVIGAIAGGSPRVRGITQGIAMTWLFP